MRYKHAEVSFEYYVGLDLPCLTASCKVSAISVLELPSFPTGSDVC